MPVVRGAYCLDLPFHLYRLRNGARALISCLDPFDDVNIDNLILDSIKRSLPPASPLIGIVVVALFCDEKASTLQARALCTEMSVELYTASISPTTHVDLQRFQRSLPQHKDIKWPIERKIIEARRKQPVSDTIMIQEKSKMEDNGDDILLTEGLISNFYVVDKFGKIVTCPSHKVLPGSMTRIVAMIAKEEGIEIAERPIMLADINSWKAAFLVSSCKPIHFVSRIFSPEGNLLRTFEQNENSFHEISIIKNRLIDIFRQQLYDIRGGIIEGGEQKQGRGAGKEEEGRWWYNI